MRFDDFTKNRNTTLSQKIWAQKRGFLSGKISLYGLTDENYRDFLPDFDYYRLHPINRDFSHWIDDKLTMKYILQPFSKYLPEYYYQLCRNEILRLMDCPPGYGQSIEDIILLLKEKHFLAAKLIAGSDGEGFTKLAWVKNEYFMNNRSCSAHELETLLNKWVQKNSGSYLITEYLSGNKELGRIWSETPNTLRIMVIRERGQTPKIVRSYWRFGSKKTGVVDNAASEGVTCKVDIISGFFSDARILDTKNRKWIDCRYHPDTNALVEGIIPFWGLINEKIIEICCTIPQVRYLGFDIIITDDGFKIIEINSHQGITYFQSYDPLLTDPACKSFFLNLLEDKTARTTR